MEPYELINADTYETVKNLPTACLDAVVTDPPYELGYGDNPNFAWDQFPPAWFWKELRRVVRPGGTLAFLISPHVAHARVSVVLEAGWKVMEVGAWIYGNGRPVHVSRPRRCFDLVYFLARDQKSRLYAQQARLEYVAGGKQQIRKAGKLTGQHLSGHRNKDVVWTPKNRHPANVACQKDAPLLKDQGYDKIFAVKKVIGSERLEAGGHPTVKPVDLMAQIIRLAVPQGGRVGDFFMGSGSTGVAAVLSGYRFLGVERSEIFFRAAQGRLREALGQVATPQDPPG